MLGGETGDVTTHGIIKMESDEVEQKDKAR